MWFVLGARERQQLLAVFALSNKYQPPDVALAVTSQLHMTMFNMCQGSLLAIQPSPYHKAQVGNTTQLPVVLQVACWRLLQIIAVTAGWICCSLPYIFSQTIFGNVRAKRASKFLAFI